MIKKTTIATKQTGDKLSASEFNQLNNNFNSVVGDALKDFKVSTVSEFGGTVVSGTEGQKQSVVKIPVANAGTIDFDFKCDYDPHVSQGGVSRLYLC